MAQEERRGFFTSSRVLIIGLLVVVIVPGLALVLAAIARSAAPTTERINVLANSTDACVTCHARTTPGIVEQYGHSTMAAANIACVDCHEVEADYPGAIEHEGTFVLNQPTTAMCQTCHQAEVAQYNQSRHGLPAYVAMVGVDALSEELRVVYDAIPEVEFGPIQSRNALYHIEGPTLTRFACESCHNIGKPAADNSIGQCQKCHIRHEFSLEQARKPETCNNCHIGPDHPQWEIYEESKHGIAYATSGETWNWEAEPGTLSVVDFPAPTCAICHLSGFGGTTTTHDVGDRLTWYLFAPISDRRPSYQDNRVRMQTVCFECHNPNFIEDMYVDADALVEEINVWVRESDQIIQPLKDAGIWTDEPFDLPVDFVHYEFWHHWGRTAKFGAWMQGADYTQWHGVYEMLSDKAELKAIVSELLGEAPNVEVEATPEVTPESDGS
jgi:hypothetical protein